MHLCEFVGDAVCDVCSGGGSRVGAQDDTILEGDGHTVVVRNRSRQAIPIVAYIDVPRLKGHVSIHKCECVRDSLDFAALEMIHVDMYAI